MRLDRLLVASLLLMLAGCESGAFPTAAATSDLAGRWGWAGNGNPGGSYMTLALSTAGSQVTGTGGVCGIGPSCNPGPVTVLGTGRAPLGSFTLVVTGAGGYLATYAGRLVGTDQIQGTWTTGSQSWQVVFDRCTATSFC